MQDHENRVLFTGAFNKDQVTIHEIPSSRKIDQQLEEECIHQWELKKQEAEATGKLLWDSETYRFESFKSNKDHVQLVVSTIPFSIRKGMSEYKERITELGGGYSPQGMYTSSFVVTKDEKYVFIEDAGKYLDRRPVMFIGGVLSKTEKELKTGVDIFSEAEKECIEEAGCQQSDIASIVLNGGFMNISTNVGLVFTVSLNINFAELLERFKGGNDGEAKGLIAVQKDQIAEFGRSMDEKEIPKFVVAGLV